MKLYGFPPSPNTWKVRAVAAHLGLGLDLEFVDLGGHGYAKVHLTAEAMRTEFVCIPRPIERSAGNDGGPLRYRIAYVAKLWRAGERPQLAREVIEGDPGLG